MAAAPRLRAARRAALRASAAGAWIAARAGLVGLAGLAVPLAGCGFRLRTAPPLAFERVHLAGFAPRSPLEAALRRALGDRVRLVGTPAEADLVLRALAEERERSVAASTAAGQVRELQLRLRVTVRADGPDGRERMAPVTLRQLRELRTTETAAQAKAVEEELLYRAMLDDIVEQLLRRLAALQP